MVSICRDTRGERSRYAYIIYLSLRISWFLWRRPERIPKTLCTYFDSGKSQQRRSRRALPSSNLICASPGMYYYGVYIVYKSNNNNNNTKRNINNNSLKKKKTVFKDRLDTIVMLVPLVDVIDMWRNKHGHCCNIKGVIDFYGGACVHAFVLPAI